MRIPAIMSVALLGGCATVYTGPPPGSPRAHLSVQADVRRDVSEGVDIALFDNPNCLVTEFGGFLGIVPRWPEPLVADIPANQKIYVLTHRLTTDMSLTAVGLRTASSDCYELVSFVPADGASYTMRLAIDARCDMALADGTGQNPLTFEVAPLDPACERVLMDFKRAE